MKTKKSIINEGADLRKNADIVMNFSQYCEFQKSIMLRKIAKTLIGEYGYYYFIDSETDRKIFVTI